MITYLYIGLLLLGVLLSYSAWNQYQSTKRMMSSGFKTQARVIDFITITSRDGNFTFKPVFEYTDMLDSKVVFEGDIASYPKAYDLDEKVTIIHSEDNEEQRIVSFWGLYRGAIILLSLASPFLIIGGSYLVYKFL